MQNWLASWGIAMHQKHFIHDFFHAHAVGYCSPYVASSLGYSAHGHCKLGESLTFFHTWAWHIQQVAKLGTSSILHLVSLPNIHILGMHDSHPCWLGTCVKLPGSFTLAVLSHSTSHTKLHHLSTLDVLYEKHYQAHLAFIITMFMFWSTG